MGYCSVGKSGNAWVRAIGVSSACPASLQWTGSVNERLLLSHGRPARHCHEIQCAVQIGSVGLT